jgi:hypothetical protein
MYRYTYTDTGIEGLRRLESLYCCFAAVNEQKLYYCFTTALLLLYCCFATALLLLYYCFTTAYYCFTTALLLLCYEIPA